jgi:hypothetical protein
MVLILMGVSGTGKTTIGKILASVPGWAFIIAQVQNDAREETGFRNAQKNANGVETPQVPDKHRGARNQPPQLIMMRAIQRRAPTRRSSRLLVRSPLGHGRHFRLLPGSRQLRQ